MSRKTLMIQDMDSDTEHTEHGSLEERGSREAPQVLEFFAGIGLARLGLEAAGMKVIWANDYESQKRDLYLANFGYSHDCEFVLGDIRNIKGRDLSHNADVAWGSSPCTDLSLAGGRAGINGAESGTFWEYIRILREMNGSRPPVAVLENVTGLATSHAGEDIGAAIRAFNSLGYSVDVLAIDARRFVPQSRPRLFLVACTDPPSGSPQLHSELRPDWLQPVFADPSLTTHRANLPQPPAPLMAGLDMCIEPMTSTDGRWWGEERTGGFLASLSAIQRRRIDVLMHSPSEKYRTAYRRTRNGKAVWEVRPDSISGCLRTAKGGSSKQAVVRLGDGRVQVRWMTPQEYATLMGASHYTISGFPDNQIMFGFGDAVVVPVVEWLARHYIEPLLDGSLSKLAHSRQTLRLF